MVAEAAAEGEEAVVEEGVQELKLELKNLSLAS
jgi:hypothetical protein